MTIYQSPNYKPPDEPELPEGYVGTEFPKQVRPRIWEAPMKGIVPLREEIPKGPPSATKTFEMQGYRNDYGDFQIDFIKELDAMEAMSSAMLLADKGNAAGDPDLTAYATAKHQLRSQEILGYRKQTESALDIIFQKPWLSNREKWNIFEQAKAKIRKPIATPEEVPAMRPEKGKTYEDLIRQIQLYDKELSIFAENADINPGWGTKIVPVALVNAKTGDPIREASPEESAYFHSVKARRTEVMGKISEITGATRPTPPTGIEMPPKGEWWEETKFRLKGGTLEGLEEQRRQAARPSMQMQSAPDMTLDPYWRTVPDDMKPLVWRAFREGDTPEQILNELRNRGIIK